MKIAIINGSPKIGKSNSEIIINKFYEYMDSSHEISNYKIDKHFIDDRKYTELYNAEALVLVFPLYIDAIPSNLFRMMVKFEEEKEAVKNIHVYAIINNGFYEGFQNKLAIKVLENWCARVGMNFGMGIAQGAGEAMEFLKNVPVGHGPLKNLGSAMSELADTINRKDKGESKFFSPNIPRSIWKFKATYSFWNKNAKKNGLKVKEIRKVIL